MADLDWSYINQYGGYGIRDKQTDELFFFLQVPATLESDVDMSHIIFSFNRILNRKGENTK